jgi:hypothetical protein
VRALLPHTTQHHHPTPTLASTPGNTLMSNPLTAIGTFMVNAVQQQLKEVGGWVRRLDEDSLGWHWVLTCWC